MLKQMEDSALSAVLKNRETELLTSWINEQTNSGVIRNSVLKESELRQQCREFLNLFRNAINDGVTENIQHPQWTSLRDMLANVSASRAAQGFTPTETATFVFSFKKPLFTLLREECGSDANTLTDAIWNASLLIDNLALFTMEAYMKAREEVILRQQEEMLELSTPVIKLWDGILALPMIGTLDSARTQVVMETLLQRIVETGAEIAILDITGVPTVDTLVAQHLLKTAAAARLMGADCIISGIRPQIAQTIVHLGVDLSEVITKATLADAFLLALKRTGATISRSAARP